MLSSEDKGQLIDALCLTAEAIGTTISPATAMMMADDLSDYSLNELGRALRACRMEIRNKLTVADIIQRCQAEDGRPGKDEAWSIGLESSDEYGTAVMTWEIQQAMSAALPIMNEGDNIGARMAFMSAYERLVRQSRQEVKPVEWIVSLGISKERRAEAIQKAVQLQRIPQETAGRYMKGLYLEAPSATGQAIAGLLTGKVIEPSPDSKEKLSKLREDMMKMRNATAEEKIEMRIKAANELADRQALLAKQVDDLNKKRED